MEISDPMKVGLLKHFLRNKGELRMRIKGTSMGPLYKDGHIAVIQPVQKICLGDIVIFEQNTNLVIHRIVLLWWSSVGWKFRTKGDGCRWYDPDWLTEKAVVGQVESILSVRNRKIYSRRNFFHRFFGMFAALLSNLAWFFSKYQVCFKKFF